MFTVGFEDPEYESDQLPRLAREDCAASHSAYAGPNSASRPGSSTLAAPATLTWHSGRACSAVRSACSSLSLAQ